MSSGFNLFRDWIDISPIQTGQFTTISVEGLVPDNATGVILRVANQTWKARACVRKIGSSLNPDWFQLMRHAHAFAFCGLDDLKFEAWCENLSYASFNGNPVKIYLCGYTDEAVGFLPELVQTTDCSSLVPSEATGGIWLVYSSHPTTGRSFAIKGYGSTDKHYNSDLYGGHATHIVSIDAECNSFIYALVAFGEGKKIHFRDRSGDGFVKPYLIGYTKPPVHFFLNSILKSPTESGNWHKIDMPELPAEADGIILEIRNTAPGRKALSTREIGSTNDSAFSNLGLETAIWDTCGITDGGFEAWVDWKEKAMFFIHGYTIPEGTLAEFPCPYCSEVFATQQELDDHIANEHPQPTDTITIESGVLEGDVTISGSHISIDIAFGHIEGEIS